MSTSDSQDLFPNLQLQRRNLFICWEHPNISLGQAQSGAESRLSLRDWFQVKGCALRRARPHLESSSWPQTLAQAPFSPQRWRSIILQPDSSTPDAITAAEAFAITIRWQFTEGNSIWVYFSHFFKTVLLTSFFSRPQISFIFFVVLNLKPGSLSLPTVKHSSGIRSHLFISAQ